MRRLGLCVLFLAAACAPAGLPSAPDESEVYGPEGEGEGLFASPNCSEADVCPGPSQSRRQCFAAGLTGSRRYETVQTFDVPRAGDYNFLRLGLNKLLSGSAGVLRAEVRELTGGFANLASAPVRGTATLAVSLVSRAAAIHELRFATPVNLGTTNGTEPRYALVLSVESGSSVLGIACNDATNLLASGVASGRKLLSNGAGGWVDAPFRSGVRDLAFALGFRSNVGAGPCSESAGATCDDGNQASGDGCSASCTSEVGYVCSGQPSTCTPGDFVTYTYTSNYALLPTQVASMRMYEDTANNQCLIKHVTVGDVVIPEDATWDRIGDAMVTSAGNQSGPVLTQGSCESLRVLFDDSVDHTAIVYPDGTAIQLLIYRRGGAPLINWYYAIPNGIVTAGASRNWNGGTFATSCQGYRTGAGGHAYLGATGSGLYTIDRDGTGGAAPFDVFCDMETDGGGWRIVSRVVATDPSYAFGGGAAGTLGGSAWNSSLTGVSFSKVLLKYGAASVTRTLNATHTWTASGARLGTTDGQYFEYILRDHHGAANHLCAGPLSTPYGGMGGDVCTRVFTNGGDNGQLGWGLGTAMNVNFNFDDRSGFFWDNAVVANANGATISAFDVGVQ